MSDLVTITREQFEAFYRDRNYTAQCQPSFDSLKSFVEKPKRREWYLSCDLMDRHKSAYKTKEAALLAFSDFDPIHVTELLPGDIGPMTKDDAREWVTMAIKKFTWGVFTERGHVGDCIPEILKALGLGEP